MFPHVSPSMERRFGGLAVFALLFLCAEPAASQTILWQVQASSPCTVFGEDVLSAGDFDGDGLQDLLVGEPSFNPGGIANAGRVTLWSGATQQLLFSFAGTLVDGGVGAVLGRPGDLTGDGITDLVLARVSGGPFFNPLPEFRYHHVVVLSGTGPAVAYYNGESGAAVGDLNGDGLADLVIGQPTWYDPTCSFGWAGRAYALSGATGPLLAQWLGATPCVFEQMGVGVEPLGDITGDGLPDFAVGSRGSEFHGTPPFVRVFSGLGPSPVWSTPNPPAPSIGPTGFGTKIALTGDVNADGVDDILTGAPRDGFSIFPPLPPLGKAYVLSGASGAILHAFTGFFDNQHFGRAVGRLGDLDGDGHADLLIGGPFSVPWGPAVPACPFNSSWLLGRVYVFSGRTGLNLVELVGQPPGKGFGTALDGLGDLDSDDYPDFAVSEPWRPSPNPGRVLVYSGAPAGVTLFGSACAGSGGHLPRIASWPAATTGSTLALNLSGALGNTPTVLLLGLSNTSWNGIPLPLPLGAFGMPSCSLLVVPTFLFPARTQGAGAGKGRASIPVPIPSDPLLVGAAFYAQWYVVDPGPALLPGAFTRGLRVTVQ